MSDTTTSPDSTATSDRTRATFSAMTADEFEAARCAQILELLRWHAEISAAGIEVRS